MARKHRAALVEPEMKMTDKCWTATAYHFAALLIFVVLGFSVYSNTLKSPFFFDDRAHIQENRHIRLTTLDVKDIIAAGFESPTSTRPIANISFALNYYFHRYNVVGYHCTNICIHILTGIFVYFFIRNTLSIPLLRRRYRSYRQIAFFAALLWLVYPLQTQSVTYIVQRMNSMAAMFYILSLLLYVKGRVRVQERKKSWPWFGGCALAGLLSLGCKEMSATLPVFILLYEWYFFQDLSTTWLKRCLPYVIGVFIGCCLLGLWYLDWNPVQKILSKYSDRDFTLTERLLTQPRVVIYYVSLLAYPSPGRLNLDHDFALSYSLIVPLTTLVCIVAIIGLIGLAIYIAKRERVLSFCILWFFGNLVIESSIIGLELVHEHRLYLPSMLVLLAIVVLAWRCIQQNWVKMPVFCILIFLSCTWTYERNSVWADPVTLWKDCADKSPGKPRPHYNLASSLVEQGRNDEAIKYYTKTLQLDPDHFNAHINLGLAFLDEGKMDEAAAHCNYALELDPNSATAHCNMGVVFHRQDRLSEALTHYNQALGINPRLPKVYRHLGTVFYQQGKIERAIAHWAKAHLFEPNDVEILNNLAWVWATSEDPRFRNPTDAVRFAERACELTDYSQPGALDTLAAACAAAGQFDRAERIAEIALTLASTSQADKLAKQIRSRLELYRQRRPYRESPNIQSSTRQ
ncbi:MAG: tetratricopeptide repeat protein [Planctomycetota bacterium]